MILPHVGLVLLLGLYTSPAGTVYFSSSCIPYDYCFFNFQYAKMILPHVGLVLLLGLYTVCGAGIFHMLEMPHEVKFRNETLHEIWDERELFLEFVWKKIQEEKDLTFDSFLESGKEKLEKLEKILFEAYDSRYIEYSDVAGTDRLIWTFPSSIFFASTVITTIGRFKKRIENSYHHHW